MTAPQIPERPTLDGLEAKWSARWEEDGTYRFDRTRPRSEVFSIDTPPPTVSGSLHAGHVFSYTQTDVIARFQRMRGKAVFYPIGWDDNGLATERRVQNYYGVRCDPNEAYDPAFTAPETPHNPPIAVSRPNFVELCFELTSRDEQTFEELWRRLGLSFDWRHHYTTIGRAAQRTSQALFLRNLARGEAYRHEAPTLWDVDFKTAVAQAELVDKEVGGAYHRLRFRRRPGAGDGGAGDGGAGDGGAGDGGAGDGGAGDGPAGNADVLIETTRPELLPACVALVAHPGDERYRPLFGTEVLTPLFGVPVPVVAHHLADPEKGSGIAMICTFGDLTDVTWWRELSLATRTIVERDGRLGPAPFGEEGWESEDPERARAAYAELEGKTVKAAQRRIVELLRDSGDLVGEPSPIMHPVKFYEKGDRPLEIVSSRQWYLRTMAIRDQLRERGRELEWAPPYMQVRYENWVDGLAGDWALSRQRFFGVPFPIWHRLDENGEPLDELLVPDESALPVDPSTDAPEGYDESQRGRPGGFIGDPDVMDTWATSSLTPQIAGGAIEDPDLFSRVFPMDLRPQAHDIIRTWLFSTVVRAELEHHSPAWASAAISGFILDPDRKKLSKSVGNVIVPHEPIEEHGTDAVRYWAASARLGVDTAYDQQQMKVGRRLAIKLLNASRFVLSRVGDLDDVGALPAQLEPIDSSMLAGLRGVVAEATQAHERYDYARALELSEGYFWRYCDDYLELVKGRSYGETGDAGTASARFALVRSLSVLLRLFAPVLPYATEEAWSWFNEGSIHVAPWPVPGEMEFGGGAGDPAVLATVSEVLAGVRRAKTEGRVSMRAPVARAVVRGTAAAIAALEAGRADLEQAGVIEELVLEARGEALEIEVELAP
jgi:valyl-tRNA synthetase